MIKSFLLGLAVLSLGFVGECFAGPDEHLIARYTFENNTNDVTGNGHDGTLVGTSAIYGIDTTSCRRPYIQFNGAARVEIADHDDLDLVGDWTVMYWIRRELPLENEKIVQKGRSLHDSEGGYVIHHSNSEDIQAFVLHENHNNKPLDLSTENSGEWHHYGVTYSATDYRLSIYIDGELAGTRLSDPMKGNAYPLMIAGDIAPDGTKRFRSKSAFADVRFYSATLSANDIAACLLTVDAGDNIQIDSQDQSITLLAGRAAGPTGLSFRWIENSSVLQGARAVSDGDCPLDLGTIAPMTVGPHVLTLEVTSGSVVVMDNVIVTVKNSPPVAGPTGGGTYECGESIDVRGNVSDHDGDLLTFEWRNGSTVLFPADIVTAPFGGAPVVLPSKALGSSVLGVGVHGLDLVVDDGVNEAVIASITVVVVDTSPPTLSPTASTTILWPPNGAMIDVTLKANAADNCLGTPTLSVEVTYHEEGLSAVNETDYEVVAIDAGGTIHLLLRAARSGNGGDRIYTVVVTATDADGNSSTAEVEVRAPHDRRKK